MTIAIKGAHLPGGQAFAVLTANHRLMADLAGNIVEIDRTSHRFASVEQFGNMRAFHETEARVRAPEIWRDFRLCYKPREPD